jgi:hypothetical protein
MLATIGLMVGAYIFTRCIDMGTRQGANTVIKVFAALTLIFTAVCMFDLATAGIKGTPGLP